MPILTEQPERRILIVKMWALGDLLMATPILASLKARYPGCTIAWLTDIYYGEVLRNNPYLDELIEIDSGAWTREFRKAHLVKFWRESRAIRADLARRKFDIVVNLTPDKWWTLWLLAAPRRMGLYPGKHPIWTKRWYTDAVVRAHPEWPTLHNTEHYLLAARALGCDNPETAMSIGQTDDEHTFIEAFRRECGWTSEHPTILFAPFATGPNRSWETDRLAELADRLHERCGAQVILSCAPRNREEAGETVRLARHGNIIVADRTSIRELIALIRWADVTVCVDSAPMHIAGALRKPFVALFGPTPVDQRMPIGAHGTAIAKQLPCSPCDKPTCRIREFRKCMKAIGVSEVEDAVMKALEQSASLSVPKR